MKCRHIPEGLPFPFQCPFEHCTPRACRLRSVTVAPCLLDPVSCRPSLLRSLHKNSQPGQAVKTFSLFVLSLLCLLVEWSSRKFFAVLHGSRHRFAPVTVFFSCVSSPALPLARITTAAFYVTRFTVSGSFFVKVQ